MTTLPTKKSPLAGRWPARLMAVGLFLQLAAPLLAQERFLLIFDTSAAMKRRLPAVGAAITNLYASAFNGQVHTGDGMGVWTFDRRLHTGKFPLYDWPPEDLAAAAIDLTTFLRQQSFSSETSLAALQPELDQVIANSERLTILIFCDGTGEITWTPYTDGINQTLRRTQAERKDSRQPVVLVLRVEQGKYIGCSISFPPNEINFPSFSPPKPALPKIISPKPVAPVVKPVAPVPPLIIVGTKVGTNLADLVKVTEIKAVIPPAPTVVNRETNHPIPTVKTNVMVPTAVPEAPVITNAATTNPTVLPSAPAIAKVLTTNPPTTTPPAAIPPPTVAPKVESAPPLAAPVTVPEKGYGLLLPFAAGALSLAVILIIVAIIRSRRPRGSLITDSMNLPKGPLK